MLPTLKEGRVCLFVAADSANDGDVVLAKTPHREIVKRVLDTGKTMLLLGDNMQESTSYAVDGRTTIVGKLIWPRATNFEK